MAMPGHEALIGALKFDGTTTGPEAAEKIVLAERSKMGKMMDTIRATAPDPAPVSVSAEPAIVNENAPIEERAKARWDKDASAREEFNGNYDIYLAYVKRNGFDWGK